MPDVPAPVLDADGVTRHRNLTVARIQGFRPLHADLQVPPGSGRRPLIAFLHGGAFWQGSRVDLPVILDELRAPGFYERLLSRGYAVADVDYRLSGEAAFPAQLHDVQAALRWFRTFADELNLDTDRFAVWGESAGATLAALAGLDKDADVPVQAVVDWYGPTDFTGLGEHISRRDPAHALLACGTPGAADRARAASPLHQIHPDAPPFLIMHGTLDTAVPWSEGERLAEALRAAGVRADLVAVEGGGHVFQGVDDIGGLVDTVLDFLDEVL
jgi:acetyl esterase/lipase